MSKHKKKVSVQHLQKIERARHHNNFMKQLAQFVEKTAGPHIFKLLPKNNLEDLYLTRMRPFVLQEITHRVEPLARKEIQSYMLRMIKYMSIPFVVGPISEISIYDYFTIALSVIRYAQNLKENDYPNAGIVKRALVPLEALGEGPAYNNAFATYNKAIHAMSLLSSDLRVSIAVFKLVFKTELNSIRGMYICAEMYCAEIDKIQVSIHHSMRSAVQLAWHITEPEVHLEVIRVTAKQLNLPGNKTYPVYIQQHALSRLTERMDGITPGALHYCIFESFRNLNVCRNTNRELLFEYRLFGNKAGYFRGIVSEGRLILLTFLFLTNNGTPEGEKLHANTGLVKEDKIYLSIDKLSSFVNSDIAANPRLKDMFIQAGCTSLFLIDRSLYMNSTNIKEKAMACMILKYLKLDETVSTLETLGK
jgi:hypothetical protein